MEEVDKNNITIVLADDHPLLREGLKTIIEKKGSMNVIGEASDGDEALELIEKLKPSVAIVDIDMPGLSGLEVAKKIQQKKIHVKIIILTMYDKEKIFNRAMDLGVSGFIVKDSAAIEIVEAIKAVSSGKHYISSSISDFLIKRARFPNDENEVEISNLTKTERKIMKMIAENKTSKEIADELFISIHTVNAHRANICQKLNLSGTNALLHYALDHPEIF